MVLDSFSLKGKTAIVTGCNTGIGQAIAVALSEAGSYVAGVNRSDAKETEDIIKKNSGSFYNIKEDLSNINVIPEIIKKTLNKYERIDILVNNAGIIRRENAIDFTEKDFDEVLNLNTRIPFFLSQAVAKEFIKQKTRGKIINICSMLSFQGGIRVPSYTASKSAIAGITRALANEWAKFNINVNAIAPGYIETNNTKAILEDAERKKSITERIPAGYWGRPEDLKGAAVFLASDASNYLQGHILAVDGGWLAR